MSWFEELLQNGFGSLFGGAFEWIRAIASLLGIFCVVGGILIIGVSLLTSSSGLKVNVSMGAIVFGLIMVWVFGWAYGLHFFGIL